MFDDVRSPIWATGFQRALSGKASALSYQQYPRYHFELSFEYLRDDIAPSHLRSLAGLFNAMQGRADTFLFTSPAFNSVTTEPFGTGDGATVAFQLIANWQNAGGPGSPDIVQNLNGAPSIFKNAVLQSTPSQYTLGPTGIVTFVSPPAAAAPLTWTGSFYYRCRFTDDTLTLAEFVQKYWSTKSVSFESETL